jgi:hypothetical protein
MTLPSFTVIGIGVTSCAIGGALATVALSSTAAALPIGIGLGALAGGLGYLRQVLDLTGSCGSSGSTNRCCRLALAVTKLALGIIINMTVTILIIPPALMANVTLLGLFTFAVTTRLISLVFFYSIIGAATGCEPERIRNL